MIIKGEANRNERVWSVANRLDGLQSGRMKYSSCLFDYCYGCKCIYFNKLLSVPEVVGIQDELSAWEVPQKVAGLPTIGILSPDRQA